MKSATVFSDYLNHHQTAFAEAMMNENIDFMFVATTPFNEKRKEMGYRDMNQAEYVLRAYENKENESKAYHLAETSDIVIIGAASMKYAIQRLKKGGITYKATERYFKQGVDLLHFPRNYGRLLKNYIIQGQRYPLYILCSSAYTAYDVNLFSNYKGKCFKWGYFLEEPAEDYGCLRKQKEDETVRIIWAGRFLRWKHPELLVELANSLKENHYSFSMDIIGDGVMASKIKQKINEYHLKEYINLLGYIPPKKVQEHMKRANIFLLTSDFNEGWGVVLNEAMKNGCSVIASHACGSAPFLINNGINGFIYKNGDIEHLTQICKRLINDRELRDKTGKNAYDDMKQIWNSRIGAKRLLELTNAIKNGKDYCLYENGPCSSAHILANNWFNVQ